MKKPLHTTLLAVGIAALLPSQLGCSSQRGNHRAEGTQQHQESDEEEEDEEEDEGEEMEEHESEGEEADEVAVEFATTPLPVQKTFLPLRGAVARHGPVPSTPPHAPE